MKRPVVLQKAPALAWDEVAAIAGVTSFERRGGPGKLYIARAASGHIKIGCTWNPPWRVHKQTLRPDRDYCAGHGIDTTTIELLLVVKPGDYGRETALHRRFAAERSLTGPREWFKGPQIEAFVATLLARANEGAAA